MVLGRLFRAVAEDMEAQPPDAAEVSVAPEEVAEPESPVEEAKPKRRRRAAKKKSSDA
jgi:hypothetical protein